MKEKGWTFFSTVLMTVMWCFTFGMLSADWGKATNEGIYLMGIICGGTSTFFTWLTLVKWNE
jgi:hypothetical protein